MGRTPADCLGSRQHALNARVNAAFDAHVALSTVEDRPDLPEIDKLFKIDLAARYKNVEYMIDILKSGDSLYTTRVLNKAKWLLDDEYSHIFNPEYLQNNIFPFTSLQMKRKILKTAAYITNPDRAAEFFNYSIKNKMINTAFNCLLHTTDQFKMDQLKNNHEPSFQQIVKKDTIYIRSLVKKSFEILDVLIGLIGNSCSRSDTVRAFKNLYSESEEQYLNLAEKYFEASYNCDSEMFDPKLSDSILKKHKHRVLSNPRFYVNSLNTAVLARNSNIDDVKVYATVLLPDSAGEFWLENYYVKYQIIFNIIPQEKMLSFFKIYFAENYPNSDFEMDRGFYDHQYFTFMTTEEKEQWAFRNLEIGNQMLGVGCDYLWYKFVNFDTAFSKIKEFVSVTKDGSKRNDMVEVLIESAKSYRELETLFRYYTKRHGNEKKSFREQFLNKVLYHHNVFEFDTDCWGAFYACLEGIDIYNKLNTPFASDYVNYKTAVILYYILHDLEMPFDCMMFLLDHFQVHSVGQYLHKIVKDKQMKLYDFFFSFFIHKIREAPHQRYCDVDESRFRRYYNNIEKSICLFGENEVCIKSSENPKKKRRRRCSKLSNMSLIHALKEDKDIVIQKLPDFKDKLTYSQKTFNTFMKKIKIYFPEDVAKIYFDTIKDFIYNEAFLLNSNCQIRNIVSALFQLGDKNSRIDIMNKFTDIELSNNKRNDPKQIQIQRAISRYAYLSRPPVPLSNMIVYMKKYFVYIFNSYVAILPQPVCLKFVHLVIDNPKVSIQKHAIRMAFQCISSNSLIDVMKNIWENTDNVTLRSIIYKAFYNKVLETKENDYFEIVKVLTRDLHENDEEEIFRLVTSTDSRLCNLYLGEYIEILWKSINRFKDIEPHITLKKYVVIMIQNYITLLREEFVFEVVTEHINIMINQNRLMLTYSNEDIAALYEAKWMLTAQSVVYYIASSRLTEKYVALTQQIYKKNVPYWGEIEFDNIYIYQQCCRDFFNYIKSISFTEKFGWLEDVMPVFEGIFKVMESDLSLYDRYFWTWEFQLLFITVQVLRDNREIIKINNSLDALLAIIKHFSGELGRLITDYVNSNKYFMSGSSEIAKNITKYADHLLDIIGINNPNYKKYKHRDQVLVTVVSGLMEFELSEVYLLASLILPPGCDESCKETYKHLINQLEQFQDPNVQLSVRQNLNHYPKNRCA